MTIRMPAPTKPPFDFRPMLARYEDDGTTYLRDMHPDLYWVWDELDMLREDAGALVDPRDMKAAEDELAGALDELDTARNAAQRALRLLDEIEDTTDAPRVRQIIEQAAGALSEVCE